MADHTTPLLRRNWWRSHLASLTFTGSLRLKTSLLSELGGSVGDLGTYIPIVLALTLVSNLDLSTTLIFTAFYNIITGAIFGIPMPVQPMKSIAAVAVSEIPHLTVPQIAAAGICTAGTLFFLGATGLMSFFYHFIPLPVVRGVQLSQGLAFAFSAIKYIRYNQDFTTTKASTTTPRPWLGLDGLILAFTSISFLILVTGSGEVVGDDEDSTTNSTNGCDRRRVRRRLRTLSAIPAALLVFLLGLILCFVRDPSIIHDIKFGPSKIHVLKITWEDWKTGFFRGAIPQIPLSVLNSVIAVCKLSADLFPEKEVSATRVSVSVGLMNLVGCWFGAMPCCHGAGGLAGQYRFGGRSGASVAFLGLGKLVLGLVFGSSFVRILSQFPIGILGVLLLFAGIELAMASRDMNSKEESFVMLVCAAVSLTGSSAALGFGCGIVLFLLLKLRQLDCFDSCFGISNSRSNIDETGHNP
ncbi:CCR4-NOT core ubiquitin-protein ligase subunit mot2 [Datura stramonium]|uniref:CCR4-NOT core ubiquitin-protein ligase subunit mot2 n=1 Tax=Datura stramonium TaxID=4076 RepID=A0ABS8RX01_DATST|nr:CCR4-NOT core ubiquitin-protein ligase subunit mot2 [Datura stramonium]